MELTTTWTAIRKDRALPAAHLGAGLKCASQRSGNAFAPMGFDVVVPSTYVTDQESHPPREWCV
jgi:hypothetical protein